MPLRKDAPKSKRIPNRKDIPSIVIWWRYDPPMRLPPASHPNKRRRIKC